jgi:hypothetical protein
MITKQFISRYLLQQFAKPLLRSTWMKAFPVDLSRKWQSRMHRAFATRSWNIGRGWQGNAANGD